MTEQALTVTQTDDGHYQVSDADGFAVGGPFDTNAQAWAALDELAGEHRIPKQAKVRKRGKKMKATPEPPKANPRDGKRRGAKAAAKVSKVSRKMKLAAAKAPGWIRRGNSAKFDPNAQRAYRDNKLGTFGAASEVRRIDPAVYLAEKAARGEA
ncbi:hypothetical protein IFT84_13555 [Rhizobium sp. CFBP 8762]|uniref:hypothetical protein n=1 Tax=Rhizobium sp. CFBP 8762 TaxID=2775279 RepID=UPI00177A8171|nr:hypothetical protein [Rhizobium sp. CFBP 8762]MBD8555533.1 hypothetical protein [Rhizobium sp. CFBP 8762]